jgi:hypothetical protein
MFSTQFIRVKPGEIYNKVNTLLKRNVTEKYIFACIHRDHCLVMYIYISAHITV